MAEQCHFDLNCIKINFFREYPQGRIQDLKKEGAQGVRSQDFFVIFGDFLKLKNLAQKGVGVHPLRTPPPPALVKLYDIVARYQAY